MLTVIMNKRVDICTGKRFYPGRKYREFWANMPSEPFKAEFPFGALQLRVKQLEREGRQVEVITDLSNVKDGWHRVTCLVR